MSKNWPGEIEEKLILTDDPHHKIPYSGSDGIKEKFYAKTKNRKKVPKRVLILAATLLIASISAFAGRNLWHVTNPGTYEGDYLKVEETKHISFDESINDPTVNESVASAANPDESQASDETQVFDDRYFLAQTARTVQILSCGKNDLNGRDMTIRYQTNEIYERAEAEVSFQLEEKPVNVRFDRESGYLIGISYWPGEAIEDKEQMSESDVVFTAMDWYEKLHFPQGYLYNNLTKMDDHMWFLDFSRQVEIEVEGEKLSLSNPYETVRLGIDPCNGALVLANVFYIPLLDDHEEDMKVLTKEEAMRIAIWYYGKLRAYTDAEIKGLLAHAENAEENLKNITIFADVCIALPRYESLMDPAGASVLKETNAAGAEETDAGSTEETDNTVTVRTNDKMLSYRNSKVSRLAWKVYFEKVNNLFTDRCDIAVDLYTGEVIAVESTK